MATHTGKHGIAYNSANLTREEKEQYSSLKLAVAQNNISGIEEILAVAPGMLYIKGGARRRYDKGSDGFHIERDTLLDVAVDHGAAGSVKTLLKNGIRINRTRCRLTPFRRAIIEHRPECVQAFLDGRDSLGAQYPCEGGEPIPIALLVAGAGRWQTEDFTKDESVDESQRFWATLGILLKSTSTPYLRDADSIATAMCENSFLSVDMANKLLAHMDTEWSGFKTILDSYTAKSPTFINMLNGFADKSKDGIDTHGGIKALIARALDGCPGEAPDFTSPRIRALWGAIRLEAVAGNHNATGQRRRQRV